MHIYREVTPLKDSDVFVVLDSVSNGFDYPLHNHPEFELNLVLGMSGTRIVGDSTERYADADLVLIGPYLYHKWDGDAHLQENGQPYRVITIQFAINLFSESFLRKERFFKIRKLLQDSSRGVQFGGRTFEEAVDIMVQLTEDRGFVNILDFLRLLDLLAQSTEYKFLASAGFSPHTQRSENNRIQVAYAYILRYFEDPALRIGDVAAQVNMSPSAFSHFFRKCAFRSFTQFLVDVRVGNACKLLIDTDEPVKTIAFKSGFNNLSNFNRLFKKYRNCSPEAFRQRHAKKMEFDWTQQVTPWQFMPTKSQDKEIIKPVAYATRLVHS
jgi:AraC-like DNA-binding protein